MVSVYGFKLGEDLVIKRHAKRFAENKEIDSCTKVRIGMHGSYPIREEKCFKTFWC
jgi:hypothetical protein